MSMSGGHKPPKQPPAPVEELKAQRADDTDMFLIGDLVEKVGGDYYFRGDVRAAIVKKSGAVRYVVEDDRGLLFIFRKADLRYVVPR